MQPTSPEVLTPERIDAMLSRAAEVCMAGIEEAGSRMQAAEDAEAFERCGRTLNVMCRNLRQLIAMKQRFDRDQIVIGAERRRAEDEEEKDARAARREAGAERQAQVRRHFGRVLWEVYEDEDDAQEDYEALDEFLGELVEAEDFLDVPYDTLIERLSQEYCPQFEDDEADKEAATAVPQPPPPLEASPKGDPPPAEPPPWPPDPRSPPSLTPWERVPVTGRSSGP